MSYPGKFARDLAMFGASIQTRADEIFERVVELSYESIANGSNITGPLVSLSTPGTSGRRFR